MNSLFVNILGGVVVLFLAFLFSYLKKKYSLILSRRDPRIPSVFLGSILIIWGIAGIIYVYMVYADNTLLRFAPIYLIWSFSIVFYFWKQRQRFREIGIAGGDRQVIKGIDYKTSLKLCNNKLKFLGIGARKLTEQDEFEKTIRRCQPEKPIRLLLCKPTHEILRESAIRFGVDREEYKIRVIASLREIRDLHRKYKNIEVRFYSGIQLFRLMFIDDSICLLSFNVMGQGDGSQLPQLHLLKGQKEINSFYYPLERYFDGLWNSPDTEIWNFTDYLDEQ